MKKTEFYNGANATRNSVCKNPSAYVGRSNAIFGVAEFRSAGFATEAMRDAVAEKSMNAGYSKKKNPVCSNCFTMKSISGSCNC